MTMSPSHDVSALPDLAHFERYFRLGPVVPLDELLHPLPGHAEHPADLSRTHEVMHGGNHRLHASSHLTMGQECGKLVT